jgi:hypothetical protein
MPKDLWKRLFAPKNDQTPMMNPGGWLSEIYQVVDKIEPTLMQAEREFRQSILAK